MNFTTLPSILIVCILYESTSTMTTINNIRFGFTNDCPKYKIGIIIPDIISQSVQPYISLPYLLLIPLPQRRLHSISLIIGDVICNCNSLSSIVCVIIILKKSYSLTLLLCYFVTLLSVTLLLCLVCLCINLHNQIYPKV